MANSRTKNSGKTNPGPKSQNLGSRKSSRSQNQNSTVKDDATYHSEPQPTTANTELEKPHKGRGRPKKATAADTPAVNTNEQPPPTKATTRKHVRDDVASVGNQPASKHTKADDTGVDQLPEARGKVGGSRKAAEVTPRDPLPGRKGRNVHPAPKTTTRRSSQEVAAEREAKKKAIEKRIKELEDAKRLLAETNASEDIDDDAMVEDNPQRLLAAIRKRRHIELESSSDGKESFDFKDVDETLDLSESEEPVQETVVS